VAIAGQYGNFGDVIGTYEGVDVTDIDPSHYFGVDRPISLSKEISIDGGITWFDANNAASAPVAAAPSDAEYRITVINTGDMELENVEISDDTIVFPWPYVIGNLTVGQTAVIGMGNIPQLDVVDRCTTSGTFLNIASVTANPVALPSVTVSDDDTANLRCGGNDNSCNSIYQADIGVPGDPIFIGGPVPVSIEIGAGAIDGGLYLDIDKLTFGPDCGQFQGINTCTSLGNDVTFNNDIVTDCTGIDSNPVTFTTAFLPFPDVFEFVPNSPIRNYDPATALPGQPTSCNITFSVTINSFASGQDTVREAFGWNLPNGVCDNLESTAQDNTFSIVVDQPKIDIEKFTNGEQADNPTGTFIPVGDPVNWRYDVTNTGNTPLFNVRVNDDVLGPIGQGNPDTDCDWVSSSDPGSGPGELSAGETVSCSATSVAIAGQYGNFGDVIGTYEGVDVTDIDPSHYFGVMQPRIPY
jgi:hypothetical protein